jgi:Fur family ferric uptake transcriptional regulator
MSLKKHRMTEQRRMILEEIGRTRGHPSASDVYEKVRRRLPHISLGTVYRNLEVLSSQGLISRLDMGSGQRRFDAVTDDHHHIRCLVCNRVDDIRLSANAGIDSIKRDAEKTAGYEVKGFSVDLYGICPRCRSGNTEKVIRDDSRKNNILRK